SQSGQRDLHRLCRRGLRDQRRASPVDQLAIAAVAARVGDGSITLGPSGQLSAGPAESCRAAIGCTGGEPASLAPARVSSEIAKPVAATAQHHAPILAADSSATVNCW